MKTRSMDLCGRQAVAASVMAVTLIASPVFLNDAKAGDDSPYYEMSCRQLWYERNVIFAERGQCFKTQRAIRTFGKRCYPPYGRLPGRLKSIVNKLRQIERAKGC